MALRPMLARAGGLPTGEGWAYGVRSRPVVAAMAMFEGTPTGPAVTARLVGKDLVPWLREYDGFRGVLVLTGDEKHGVITLWDTREDEASTRPARLAMHGSVSAAAGMSLVDYQVYDLPVLDVVGTGLRI